MKEKKKFKKEDEQLFTAPETFKAVGCAWLVPGLGHWILGRKKNAYILCACIILSLLLGIYQGGDLFPFSGEGKFRAIGAFSQMGSGVFYFFARLVSERGTPLNVTYDFGTIYFLIAGMLNWLAVIDAFDISVKRK